MRLIRENPRHRGPRKKRSVPVASAVEDARGANVDKQEQSPKPTALQEVGTFAMNIGLTAAVIWLVFTFVFGVYIMDGEGMYPRIRDGDLVLYYRLDNEYDIDSVLTFKVDGTRYTARYIAMEGDIVDITDEGQLLINGSVQSEEIFYATYQLESDMEYPYEVPEGCIFLLGDFRTYTVDSRVYGAVSLDEIDGKVITIIRRRGI